MSRFRTSSTMNRIATVLLTAFVISLSSPSDALADFGRRPAEPQFGISAVRLESSDKNIVPGKAVEQRMSGGNPHTYKIDLQAGEFLQATVEQKGINLELTLYAPPPGRRKIVRVNLTLESIVGRESVSYEATETGCYQLEVRAVNRGAPSGLYQLVIARHPRTTGQDEQRIKAERLLLDAIQLSNPQQSIEKAKEALKLWQALGDHYWEAYTFGLMANDLGSMGRVDEALKSHNQALNIFVKIGNRHGEASRLNGIGNVHLNLSQYKEAFDYYNKALSIYQEMGSRQGQGLVLINLGVVSISLNDLDSAAKYYERALRIFRDDKDRYYEGVALSNLGVVYLTQKRYQKSIGYFDRAFRGYHAVGNRLGKGSARHNVGLAYSALTNFESAAKSFQQALSIYQVENDRRGEGLVLRDIGRASYAQGDYAKALDYFQQALGIFLEVKIDNPYDEAEILKDLMLVWSVLDKPNLAIFYGKQSVNLIQRIRQNIGSLSREERQKFLESKEDIYRRLADLLITQDRLGAAEQVLRMLKEEEYFQFVMRGQDALRSEPIPLNDDEKKLKQCSDSNSEEMTDLFARLKTVKKESGRSAALDDLIDELEQAKKKFLECVDIWASELKRGGQESKASEVSGLDGLQSVLRRLEGRSKDSNNRVAALYTLAGEDHLQIILLTSETQTWRTVKIKKDALNRMVFEFRQALGPAMKPDHLPLAQQLYQCLVEPVADILKASDAKTILWSLDGMLRYLPIAALHDGEKYMVESYQNVSITLALGGSMSSLTEQPSEPWRALGLGVSMAHAGFPALSNVKDEMNSIIRRGSETSDERLPGDIYFDNEFTRASLRDIPNYPVVHIASHFAFRSGDATQSFLLLGDGSHWTLADVRSAVPGFDNVDLLTLSACETAMGGGVKGSQAEGREVESFGVIAQIKGAKSVIATLWQVDDRSTSLLMHEFYKHKMAGRMTKAEALRQAQLALLSGEEFGESGSQRRKAESPEKATPDTVSGRRPKQVGLARYAHPYYWAPFILIGNWQ